MQPLMKEKSEKTGGSLGAMQLFLHPQQGRNGFGVYDFSCHGHAYSLVEREKTHSNALILFRLGKALLQPASQIHGPALIQKPWTHVKAKSLLPAGSRVAGLLQQLTFGGSKVVLSRIHAASREFPHTDSRSIPILPFQQNTRRASGFVQWQNHDRTGMPDHVTAGTDIARLFHFVRHHAKDRTTERSFGKNNTDCTTRIFCLRHENNIRVSTAKKQKFATRKKEKAEVNVNKANHVAPVLEQYDLI